MLMRKPITNQGGSDRCDIVAKIIDEITSHGKGKEKFKEDVKNLETVSQPSYQFNPEISSTSTQRIQNWYNNHKNVPLEDESLLVPVGTVWNYRLVIHHVFRDQIAKEMKKSGLKSSDKAWIQRFQLAINEVITSEGGEEVALEKYGEMAKTWNETEPPEDLKRR